MLKETDGVDPLDAQICEQHPDQGWPHDALRGAGDALPSMQRGRTVATARRLPVVREVASLAARGASAAAFDGRCIRAGGVAPPSNTFGILGCRALPSRRLARLGATRHLHHGLLGPARLQQSGSPRSDQGFHFVGSLKNGRYWQALPVHDQTQFPSVWMHPHFAHCQMRLDAFRLFHREAVG